MAKLGRPRKKRPYHRRNLEDATPNGAADEARQITTAIKNSISRASPEVARIVIADLVVDLELMEKLMAG